MMHAMNADFWTETGKKYSTWLERNPCRILEAGSCDVNGSLKAFLPIKADADYTGIDWREGPNVDIVVLAHEAKFDKPFDVIVSASMLEHDPYWAKSIPNLVKHLAQDGMLCMSWGAALNKEHGLEIAPDGEFHRLPAGKVIRLLKELGMVVHEFLYESNHYAGPYNLPPGEGMGEVCLIAFHKGYDPGTLVRVDALIPEDDV